MLYIQKTIYFPQKIDFYYYSENLDATGIIFYFVFLSEINTSKILAVKINKREKLFKQIS